MFQTKYRGASADCAHNIQTKFSKAPDGVYRAKGDGTLFINPISKTEILAKLGLKSAKQKRADQRESAARRLCDSIDSTYGPDTSKRLGMRKLESISTDEYNGFITKINREIASGLIEPRTDLALRSGLARKAAERHFHDGTEQAAAEQYARKAINKLGEHSGHGEIEGAANKAMDEYASRPEVLDRIVDEVYRDFGAPTQKAEVVKKAMREAIKSSDAATAAAVTLNTDPRTSSRFERMEAAATAMVHFKLLDDEAFSTFTQDAGSAATAAVKRHFGEEVSDVTKAAHLFAYKGMAALPATQVKDGKMNEFANKAVDEFVTRHVVAKALDNRHD